MSDIKQYRVIFDEKLLIIKSYFLRKEEKILKRLICMLLTLTLMLSSIPVNAIKNVESPEQTFDEIFEEATTNELYLYNILNSDYLMKKDYVLTNSDFINIIHNIEMVYEQNHTDRITKLIQKLRNELDCPFEAMDNLTMETMAIVLYYYAIDLGLEINCDDSILLAFDNYSQLSEIAYLPCAWCFNNEMFTSIQRNSIVEDKEIQLTAINTNEINNWETTKQLRLLCLNQIVTVSDLEHILPRYLEILVGIETPMESVVKYGRQFLGVDYIYGGSSPRGFDCSGFVHYVFSNCGYDIGQRSGANSLVRNNGKSIKKLCLDKNKNIDWEKVPIGSVICFDWDGDKRINHVGIWTGESLLHASGSPSKQYARNGHMVCEFFEGKGDGKWTSKDYKFGDYWKSHVIDIVSFEDRKAN